MKFKAGWMFVLILAGLLISAPVLAAPKADPACMQEAKDDFNDCKEVCQTKCEECKQCNTVCKGEFETDKFICKNLNLVCVQECRTEEDTCMMPSLEALEACTTECAEAAALAKQECKKNNTDPNLLEQCIDRLQVAAFMCKDECHDRAKSAMRSCKDLFKVCISGCVQGQIPK